MKKLNVVLSFTFASLISISPPAFAKGVDGGGGDKCQDRIEAIRNDITDWIREGGSKGLNFAETKTSLASYNEAMLKQIALTKQNNQASISCTSKADDVQVDGVKKTCKANYRDPAHPSILCYSEQKDGHFVGGFMALSEDDEYFQVHHEFAVLARIEDQIEANTNYPLSDQITGYLKENVVKKLAIRSSCANESEDCANDSGSFQRIQNNGYTCSAKLIFDEHSFNNSSFPSHHAGGEVEFQEDLGVGVHLPIDITFDIDQPQVPDGVLTELDNMAIIRIDVTVMGESFGFTEQFHSLDPNHDQFTVTRSIAPSSTVNKTGGSLTLSCSESRSN